MATKGGGGVDTDNLKERRGIHMENPFTLKVGQVFTGFGFGCGLGIGVGRPLNLGAIPVLNQVMVAARGATDAFSGVQRHVNTSLKRVGAKNIEAGIGCGVGFGHGFGVGIALKPSVLHQIHLQFSKLAAHVVNKLGIDSSATTPLNQEILPASLQTGSNSTFHGNIRDGTIGSSVRSLALKTGADNIEYSSRTEAVLNNFLKNPLLQGEGSSLHEQDGALHSENNLLQMVLKHQVLIEELMDENKKLRQIVMEELKVQPRNLQSTFTSKSNPSCTECFECRRKQRRR